MYHLETRYTKEVNERVNTNLEYVNKLVIVYNGTIRSVEVQNKKTTPIIKVTAVFSDRTEIFEVTSRGIHVKQVK